MVRSEGVAERPDFGLDAPPVVYGFTALAVVGVALLIVGGLFSHPVVVGWGVWATVVGFVTAGLMVYSSKAGKVRVRDRLLHGLQLRGDERTSSTWDVAAA